MDCGLLNCGLLHVDKEEGIKILLPMIWRFTTSRAASEGNGMITGWDWD